jgi:hypothetical protein
MMMVGEAVLAIHTALEYLWRSQTIQFFLGIWATNAMHHFLRWEVFQHGAALKQISEQLLRHLTKNCCINPTDIGNYSLYVKHKK